MKKYTYIPEIVFFFFICDCLNYLYFRNDMGFFNFRLNPYWIIILLISSRYGFIAGFTSGLVAAVHMFYFIFGGVPTRMGIEKFAESGEFALPIAFILSSLFLGAVRQKYKAQEEEKNIALQKNEKELELIQQEMKIEKNTRELFEDQIIGDAIIVKILYEASVKFEKLEMQGICDECMKILERAFNVKKASLYIKEGSRMFLKSSLGWKEEEAGCNKSVFIKESVMGIAIEEGKLVTIKDIVKRNDFFVFKPQLKNILAMIPMKNNSGDVTGIVNIEKMDFVLFNNHKLKLMQLIVKWAGQAIGSKQVYADAGNGLIFSKENEQSFV